MKGGIGIPLVLNKRIRRAAKKKNGARESE